MASRNEYQYGTNPRKIEPDYRKTNVKKKKQVKKVPNQDKKNLSKKTKTKKKFKMSFEMKFFINSMLFFLIIFAIIASEALVAQRYKEKEGLKQKYNELLSSSNMTKEINSNIRDVASEYGMQTKSATLIDLETSDYIETSTDVVERNNGGILNNIIEWVKQKSSELF